MTTETHNPERRFRERHTATPLQLEICLLNWLGRPKKIIEGSINNFNLDGLSITSNTKLKLDQRLLLNIENDDHRLQGIPVVVMRVELRQQGFSYALKYALGTLPESARSPVYTVLKSLENSIAHPLHAA